MSYKNRVHAYEIIFANEINRGNIISDDYCRFRIKWPFVYTVKTTSEKSLSAELAAQTVAFTTYLSNWTEDRRSTLKAMKIALETHLKATDGKPNPDRVREILSQGRDSVGFSMAFFGMEDGAMFRHNKLLDENRSDEYDPRVRSWYKAAKQQLAAIISRPYIAATSKQLEITFAEPIVVNGTYLGTVGGDVSLDKILTDVLNLKVQGEGYAMLLDSANIINAHPNQELILKEATELNSQLLAGDFREESQRNQLLDIDIQGDNTLIYVTVIPKTSWLLVLTLKESVLNQPIHALVIKTISVVALILALATIGVVLMIRWMFADLKHVSEGLHNIAEGNGDLTLRIDTKSHDEIGLLANNFNRFVSSLHDIISNIRNVSEDLDKQAEASSLQANSSAQNIKIQKDEMDSVATAVNDMNIAIEDMASGANSASNAADSAVVMSRCGQEQVRKSQSSITALAEEVQKASNVILELSAILTTISGIAEQTNLLALNAAIEAARAGEQGRGFAVVADEVRVLSQRTHSSTEEIKNMIEILQGTAQNAVSSMKSSQGLAGTSVSDAETASESLIKIQSEISSINDMVTQIAVAAEEQTAVTSEINTNTTNIHSANEELTKQSEDGAQRSSYLSDLTVKIKNDLRNFKL